MSESEKDRVRRVYRTYIPGVTRWGGSNRGNHAMARERETAIQSRLRQVPRLSTARILDLGCGMGQNLGALQRGGASPTRCIGMDLLPERLAIARTQQPEVPLLCGDAARLGFPDRTFDLILVFTLFSSILDPETRRDIAREMNRVLRPGGLILWYDIRYDSPANPNVRGLSLDEVRGLFPDCEGDLAAMTLLPPLARRLGPLTGLLYPVLRAFPPLRSHRFGLLKKKRTGPAASRSRPQRG